MSTQLLSVKESLQKNEVKESYSDFEVSSIKNKLGEITNDKEYAFNRTFDVILTALGILVNIILFPIIALGIKLSSKGPILFKQARTGKMGEVFLCYKFRTMHLVDLKSKEGKPVVTQKGDRRIFWFGQLLRKTNLDELPQIFNVLKGDMSLVGPRPYPVEECTHWNNTFDDFHYRYLVKPGVTGLAQVTGYRGGTLDIDHMRERLDKDLSYVQRQSLWMDVKIIFLTVKQMVTFNTNAH